MRAGRGAAFGLRATRAAGAVAAEEWDGTNSAAERSPILLTLSSWMKGSTLANVRELRLVGVRERALLGGRTSSADGADEGGPP